MFAPLKQATTTAALSIAGRAAVREPVCRLAAAHGRSLVLCYHRIAPGGGDIIKPLSPERFAEQLDALQAIGDIVTLRDLLDAQGRRNRPLFALTFDDDDPSHVRYALPVLQQYGISATFFLSGRTLHGLGAYWWTRLEQQVAEIGLEQTTVMLGYQAQSLSDLARICRRSARPVDVTPSAMPPGMEPRDISALADAGMTIGFHTLHHEFLPLLDDRALAKALTEGRDALAAAAGAPIDLFAYPYGGSDARIADAVRRAGYRAAVTTLERPVSRRSNRWDLGRWQPGRLGAREICAEAVFRLLLPDRY